MSKLDPLRQAVAVSPDNVPLLLLTPPTPVLMNGRSTRRGPSSKRVQSIDPNRPDARVGIARILHLSGKTSEAVVRTEALITLHPNFAPAHLLLARLHAGEGNLDAARVSYERALALDPTEQGPVPGEGTPTAPVPGRPSRKRSP